METAGGRARLGVLAWLWRDEFGRGFERRVDVVLGGFFEGRRHRALAWTLIETSKRKITSRAAQMVWQVQQGGGSELKFGLLGNATLKMA